MSKKIGFWPVFGLVIGSQIGSGIFTLPSTLAPFGVYSLYGWLISGFGAVMLSLVFASLCEAFPKTGGPHVYVNEAFGKTLAFFVGWTYWVISWVSSIVVLTACISSLTPLIGPQTSIINLTLEISLLLIIGAVNCRGVHSASAIEFILTILKIVPLIIIPGIALFYFDKSRFMDVDLSKFNDVNAISYVTTLTFWGFIGLESATAAAGSVKNPSVTIPKAVISGTCAVVALYFFNTLSIIGLIPAENLASSYAPYVDAASIIFRGNWYILISVMTSIVCIGTLNAWMLASGQIALGIAQDGLIPSRFMKKNRFGAPAVAVKAATIGIIPFLFITVNENLSAQINNVLDMAVIPFIFVYLICCISYLKLVWVGKINNNYYVPFAAILSIILCICIITTTSLNTIIICALFTLSGLPIYLNKKFKS